jgi:general secretion pathway protein L
MREVDRTSVPDLRQAIAQAAGAHVAGAEAIAVALSGEQVLLHRLTLPKTAERQLEDVLPYEIEAQVPIDMEELSYDSRLLPTEGGTEIQVLVAATRTERVRECIELCQQALGREPDRVLCGGLPLANLSRVARDFMGPGPIALIDLGATTSDVVFLEKGQASFARTLSRGVQGLPASAPLLAAELRQTFAALGAQSGAIVQAAYLVGGGAAAQGADAYLAHELNVSVIPFPEVRLDGLTEDQRILLPRFSKALALALAATGRGHDLDLRQGELSFQRGYGFLKEKLPLLAGLAAAIVISFLFSTWAEARSLNKEQEILAADLVTLTNQAFGQELTDPEEAAAKLSLAKKAPPEDPIPMLDALDVINEISKRISMDITHDIEEFELSRGTTNLRGIVGSTGEAQKVSSALKEQPCFNDVKISKISQVVNSDRQKYIMEFQVACPEEQKAKKKKAKSSEGDET